MTARVEQKRSLKSIVGAKTYSVWTEMLHHLVPDSRTHRLAPMVAGMLQYAATVACEKFEVDPPERSVGHSLLLASEQGDPKEVGAALSDVVERLFEDSKVNYRRTGARGQEYSVVDSVLAEFLDWESMPWE